MSAYAFLFGQFDYNKAPLVPPGTKVVAHDHNRSTWAPNGEEGWKIGPALEHYRCITVYFPKTRMERQVDTVTFFPTVVPYPEVKLEDFLRQ